MGFVESQNSVSKLVHEPLPFSSDTGLLSVVISEWLLINGLPMRFVGCVLGLLF